VRAGAARAVSFLIPYARLALVPGDVTGTAGPVVAGGRYVFEVGNRTVSVELCERAFSGGVAMAADACR
jgi:hypothetical protein